MGEIEKLVERITQLEGTGTSHFTELREARNLVKAELSGVLLEIKKLQQVQNDLDSAERTKTGIAEDVKRYADYKRNKTEDVLELADCPYHNTLCMKHADKICHQNCSLDETTTAGSETFRGCLCMAGGPNCRICECDHLQHYHARKIPKMVTLTVEEIMQVGVRQKFVIVAA